MRWGYDLLIDRGKTMDITSDVYLLHDTMRVYGLAD